MSQVLKLTYKELENLVNNRLTTKRFEEVFDDIPMYHSEYILEKGETHHSYIEDDQREYRWYIFKDTLTDIEYCINYTYHPDFPGDITDIPGDIKVVENAEESDIYEPPNPVVIPEANLSSEEKNDKELWAKYEAIANKKKIEDLDKPLPKKVIKEITDFLKIGNFNIFQLRAKVIPVCIEYELEEKSFWNHVQKKTYKRK